ncbi:WAT1-related protein At1g43650-like isoform X1 [Actinidia eriantha]|uniref:WAT1-related protein At1g43650-like isoform X1 n=2 Tax=Actinidia eriantha TaxID=165200 RepID=UPI002583F24C|nr:WAT1-related protein At1g43650-like isoform X1 [Actinidia eriantha]
MKGLRCFVMVAMESNNPYIAMLFTQFIYAGMALFSKAAIAKGMNPFVFVAYRQGFATIALAPFAFFIEREKSVPLSYNLLWKIFLVSLFGLTLSLNIYYFAMNYTSATLAAATPSMIPTITFIMAIFLRLESVSMKQCHGIAKVLGSLLCVSGALVFAFVKGPPINLILNNYTTNQSEAPSSYAKSSSKGEWVKGTLIMLLANTAWSLWLIIQVPIVKQYPAKLRLTTLQCFFSCIQTTVWAMAMERNVSSWKLRWDFNLLSVAYCGIFVNGITYWLQVWVIEQKGPVFTAAFTPLALVITAIFSAFFWKEILHLGSVCGAVLLVGGLYGVLWGKNREGKRVASEQKSDSKERIILECITTHH